MHSNDPIPSNQGHTSNRGRPRFLRGVHDDENNVKTKRSYNFETANIIRLYAKFNKNY